MAIYIFFGAFFKILNFSVFLCYYRNYSVAIYIFFGAFFKILNFSMFLCYYRNYSVAIYIIFGAFFKILNFTLYFSGGLFIQHPLNFMIIPPLLIKIKYHHPPWTTFPIINSKYFIFRILNNILFKIIFRIFWLKWNRYNPIFFKILIKIEIE